MDPGRVRARDHAGRRAPSCRRTSTACRATWTRSSAIAARHNLRVIEDCAHALGATYDGRPVGTFGDAGFFSFQTLKPLNCYGGGLALVRDAARRRAVRALAEARAVAEREARRRTGCSSAGCSGSSSSRGCSRSARFPILWVSSLIGANPDVYLWEEIRSLDPLPERVHRALSQRAGGDRPRGARASRRLDRAARGATRA